MEGGIEYNGANEYKIWGVAMFIIASPLCDDHHLPLSMPYLETLRPKPLLLLIQLLPLYVRAEGLVEIICRPLPYDGTFGLVTFLTVSPPCLTAGAIE
jgi:hypothetical protein